MGNHIDISINIYRYQRDSHFKKKKNNCKFIHEISFCTMGRINERYSFNHDKKNEWLTT